MKRNIKYSIPMSIILGALIYLFATPTGALRFAVLRCGYPLNAVHISISTNSYKTPDDIEKNQTIYTIINPPIEEATQSPLENWLISKYGPFYFGEYYGW